MFVTRKYVVTVTEEKGLPTLHDWLQTVVRVEAIYEVPEGYRVEIVKEVHDGDETVD